LLKTTPLFVDRSVLDKHRLTVHLLGCGICREMSSTRDEIKTCFFFHLVYINDWSTTLIGAVCTTFDYFLLNDIFLYRSTKSLHVSREVSRYSCNFLIFFFVLTLWRQCHIAKIMWLRNCFRWLWFLPSN